MRNLWIFLIFPLLWKKAVRFLILFESFLKALWILILLNFPLRYLYFNYYERSFFIRNN